MSSVCMSLSAILHFFLIHGSITIALCRASQRLQEGLDTIFFFLFVFGVVGVGAQISDSDPSVTMIVRSFV